ncbi:MAG: gliding motility-associated C-terminal domain-containing protein [Bacteroidia bacterium]
MKNPRPNHTPAFRWLLLSLLFLLVSSINSKTFATHSAGSDIKYRCLGGLQYEIEVTFYRDCGGVAEPSSITVNCKSVAGNHNLNVTLNKVTGTNGQEITVPCASSSSTCNGGTSTGIRQWVYRGTVTLPSARADWVFSYSVCCRNCSITTISNPCASNSNLYVEAKLNNIVAPCNSSPTFSNIPIAFVCVGQNFNYNHGVLDPDGDSLVYSLITPKTTATSNVSFIAPANVNNPIASSTPFTINSSTGDLNFTPSQIQIGVMAILVQEYRNNTLIGSVIRDMQVYTQACTNNLPTVSGINGNSNFTLTACAGQQICFTVNSIDPDATQNVTLTTNNGIPGATYTISGGTRPTLTFCWTPTVNDINLRPKTFTVTVRDNACPNNGIQTFSFNIYVPAPYYSVTGTNITCNAASTGTATANPVYASSYNYLWNTGATTSSISNLPAGTYTVTATDPASGCTASQTVTLSQPSGMTLTSSPTNPSCANRNNGAIDLSVSGGNAPYSYSWSNGSTSQDLTNVSSGVYTVTVTDANGCSKTNTTTLTNSYAVSLSTSPVNVNCFGQSTGSISSSPSGGVGPYTYLWNTGSTNANISNITAGSYTVTATDANGCTATSNSSVTQPAAALAASATSTNVSCFGASNGAVALNVSGGTTPYTYNWSNGSTSSSLSNITAGTYTVTVTDNKGCTASASATVSQPVAALSTTASAASVGCFGQSTGSVSLSTNGGTTPYSYNWSNGSTANQLTNVTAGTYTVTVTDANGCTTTASGTVTQPAAALSVSGTPASVACFGGNTGSVSLTVSGGTTPYSYSWSNGATSQNLTNIPAGTYTVTVTDARNCTSATGSITVTQPVAALSASAVKTNVGCFGTSTGSLTTTVSGGTTPYSFVWSNGASTQNLSGLAAGTYTLTITDSRNCQTTVTSTITQPAAALSVSTTKADVRCFGNSTGIATAIASGGTSPYSYAWSNGTSASGNTGLAAGTYTVTATDANGCSATTQVTITQPVAPLSVSGTTSNVLCYDVPSGSIIAAAAGGTSPYTYQWNNGNSAPGISSLAIGTYTVTATDANGCSASSSFTLTQPAAALSGNTSSSAALCFGQNSGSISISPSGGTAPYTYLWSNGGSTASQSNLPSGTYTVTVSDANGCTLIRSGVITQPAAALSSTISSTNVGCFGAASGSIVVTPAGGTTPYSYSWSNGATTQGVSNLSPGTFTVTITDANGCTRISNASITQPASALQLSATSTDINCTGNSIGSIDLTVSGGTAPYAYQWSNGSAQQDITNLSANTYSVTVTDANGCTAQMSQAVTQPAGALNVSSSVTNILCFGGNNGGINITATAGTPPYTYTWSNGSTSEDLSGLTAGDYTVTVTDNNGCSLTNALFVTQPSAELSATTNATAVLCFGNSTGALDLIPAGGTTPYTYSWSNGASSEDLQNIVSGNYVVTITDANGCTFSINADITQPAAALAINSTVNQLDCHDIDDGSVSLSVTGGTGNYTYFWDNGATTASINGLTTGTYNVTVTDDNGCSSTAGYNLIYTAASLSAGIQGSAALCNGDATGNAVLTVNGGTGPFQYNWSNGSTTQNLSNIPSGSYSVQITDANGCTTSTSVSIGQPAAALNNTQSATNILCHGDATGQIDFNVTGGTYPYTYSWSNGSTGEDLLNIPAGDYTVTVTDANGCTLSNTITIAEPAASLAASTSVVNVNCFGDATGSIAASVTGGTSPYNYSWNSQNGTSDLTQITSGTYYLTVIDANGCALQQSIDVTQPSAPLTSTQSLTNIDCNGNASGAAAVQVSGGTAPYNYSWSNGSSQSNNPGLNSGTYAYTITDANGCTLTGSVDLTQPQNALALSSSPKDAGCFGDATGSIDLSVAGGTPGYSYQWSNGSTNEDLINLSAGSYTVTVTDVNNCVSTQTFTVNQPQAALSAAETISSVNCNGGQDASITLSINGGSTPYTFNWSNGALTQDITGISAGIYTVMITDVNGCTLTQSYTVNEPSAALTASGSSVAVACFGNATGSISLNVSGGTAPYTYNWNNSQTSQNISNLTAGTYTVTVTDAHNCQYVLNHTISEPAAALSAAENIQPVLCHGDNSGSVTLTPAGGTAPYTYLWNNGGTSQHPTGMMAGNYTVTITDGNGCTTSKSITISEPDSSIQVSMSIGHVSCNGQATGWIDLTTSGGTGSYSYLWNDGGTVQDPQNLTAGFYTVTVTDQNGCTAQLSGHITQPALAPRVSGTTTPVSCKGLTNGGVNISAVGGTPPYNYLWNTGANTATISNQAAGTYIVTVTDANGCSSQYTTQIVEPAEVLSASGTTLGANCITGQMGTVSVTATGGSGSYTYLWNSGATESQLSGLNPGTYTVTVADANGCELTQTFVVEDNSNLTIHANGDPAICMGESVTISSDSIPNATYQWFYNGSPLQGATQPGFSTPVAGVYTMTATTVCGTYTSNPVEVTVRSLSNVSVNNNVIICVGERAQLTAGGGLEYSWSPAAGLSDPNISNPVASPAQTTVYTVTVKDQFGCTATASVTVTIMCDTLDIPNGFSPNGDGTNDVFEIEGIDGYPGNVLFIYNRWGNLVYKKKEYANEWDGRSNVNGVMFGEELPNGTYYYILDLNIDQKPINGFVVLRR